MVYAANQNREILSDFEIQTNDIILARRPDLVKIHKKRESAECWTLPSGRPHNENQRKWKEGQEIGLVQRTWKAIEDKSNGDTNGNWRA